MNNENKKYTKFDQIFQYLRRYNICYKIRAAVNYFFQCYWVLVCSHYLFFYMIWIFNRSSYWQMIGGVRL